MGNVGSFGPFQQFTGEVRKFATSPTHDRQYVHIFSPQGKQPKGKRSRMQPLTISRMAELSAENAHKAFQKNQNNPEYVKTVSDLRGHLAKITETEKEAYNVWWRQAGRVLLFAITLPFFAFGIGYIIYKRYSGSAEFEQNQQALKDAMMNMQSIEFIHKASKHGILLKGLEPAQLLKIATHPQVDKFFAFVEKHSNSVQLNNPSFEDIDRIIKYGNTFAEFIERAPTGVRLNLTVGQLFDILNNQGNFFEAFNGISEHASSMARLDFHRIQETLQKNWIGGGRPEVNHQFKRDIEVGENQATIRDGNDIRTIVKGDVAGDMQQIRESLRSDEERTKWLQPIQRIIGQGIQNAATGGVELMLSNKMPDSPIRALFQREFIRPVSDKLPNVELTYHRDIAGNLSSVDVSLQVDYNLVGEQGKMIPKFFTLQFNGTIKLNDEGLPDLVFSGAQCSSRYIDIPIHDPSDADKKIKREIDDERTAVQRHQFSQVQGKEAFRSQLEAARNPTLVTIEGTEIEGTSRQLKIPDTVWGDFRRIFTPNEYVVKVGDKTIHFTPPKALKEATDKEWADAIMLFHDQIAEAAPGTSFNALTFLHTQMGWASETEQMTVRYPGFQTTKLTTSNLPKNEGTASHVAIDITPERARSRSTALFEKLQLPDGPQTYFADTIEREFPLQALVEPPKDESELSYSTKMSAESDIEAAFGEFHRLIGS